MYVVPCSVFSFWFSILFIYLVAVSTPPVPTNGWMDVERSSESGVITLRISYNTLYAAGRPTVVWAFVWPTAAYYLYKSAEILCLALLSFITQIWTSQISQRSRLVNLIIRLFIFCCVMTKNCVNRQSVIRIFIHISFFLLLMAKNERRSLVANNSCCVVFSNWEFMKSLEGLGFWQDKFDSINYTKRWNTTIFLWSCTWRDFQ